MKPNLSVYKFIYGDSIIVNFDGIDDSGSTTHQCGYLRIIKDEDSQAFNIIVFNKHGDVVIETDVKFDFDPIEQ